MPASSSLAARWSSTTRIRPVTGRCASKYDHAARVAARFEIGERLRRLADRIAPRDQLVELEPATHVEAEHAREIDARHARPEIAAGEGLLLERQRHGAHRGRIAGLRHPDHRSE